MAQIRSSYTPEFRRQMVSWRAGRSPGRVRGFSQFERAAATGLSRPGRETAIAAFCHRFTLRQMRRTVESYALK